MPPLPYEYQFGPFTFSSDLELPELPYFQPGTPSRGLGVRVRMAAVPASIQQPTFQGAYCTASPSEFLMHIPEIASYYIQSGTEITVQPISTASPIDVRGFLLGNVFAVLCHQRRLLPLHASAVRIGEGVVAFLGASGAGKSTLAAFLAKQGCPLVSDDICLLDPAASLPSRVLPVVPWLKLWRTSLEALDQGADGLAKTFSDEDKFRVPTVSATVQHAPRTGTWLVEQQPLPLRAIVILDRRAKPTGSAVHLEPLQPVHAITQMMKFTYQSFILSWLGLQADHFANCGKGLEGAQAFICERDWTFDSLPAVFECLQKTFS